MRSISCLVTLLQPRLPAVGRPTSRRPGYEGQVYKAAWEVHGKARPRVRAQSDREDGGWK